MMDKLVGEFPAGSTYSESLYLPPKMAADMTSLSKLAGNLGDVALPSVGSELLEFILPPRWTLVWQNQNISF